MIRRGVKATTVLLLLFVFLTSGAETNSFVFTPGCMEAVRAIHLLKLKPAAEILEREKKTAPGNCAVDYLENYIDFYSLITNQDIAELHRLEQYKDIRLKRLSGLPASSPYRLYAQAEINLQWAFSRVFHEEFLTAALEFRSAYKQLEENALRFPDFSPNRKDLGMLKAMLGTVPENFKWVLTMVGMNGNFKEGMAQLREYVAEPHPAPELLLEKQSGEYYYTFLHLNFGDKQDCWKFCEQITEDYRNNLLSCYLRAFTGLKTGHNDAALACLFSRPAGTEYTAFPIMDYLTGVALLHKLDDDAAIYLKKFVSLSKGQNLIKDAYKRLSWYYFLNNDPDKYHIYKGMIKRYGAAISDEDKTALREAESDVPLDPLLLKARLLFDGGYYEQAENILLQKQAASYTDRALRIEYHYRLGRIMHEEKKLQKAIESYSQAVKLSNGMSLYFAPNSCLQLGSIYERLGNKLLARTYYEKVLTYRNYPYKFGITQKAKAALSRLKP